MNNRKFDEVMAFIEANPDRHNQIVWLTSTNGPWAAESCGTTACIAGWAGVLNGWQPLGSPSNDYAYDFEYDKLVKDSLVLGVWAVGQRELELTNAQADYLFNPVRTLDQIKAAGEVLRKAPEAVLSPITLNRTRE